MIKILFIHFLFFVFIQFIKFYSIKGWGNIRKFDESETSVVSDDLEIVSVVISLS